MLRNKAWCAPLAQPLAALALSSLPAQRLNGLRVVLHPSVCLVQSRFPPPDPACLRACRDRARAPARRLRTARACRRAAPARRDRPPPSPRAPRGTRPRAARRSGGAKAGENCIVIPFPTGPRTFCWVRSYIWSRGHDSNIVASALMLLSKRFQVWPASSLR